VPEHLRGFWSQDFWAFHSAPWWKRLWERTGIVEIEISESAPDGGKDGWTGSWPPTRESSRDRGGRGRSGQYLGWFRMVGRRNPGAKLEEYCWPDTMKSFPGDYEPGRFAIMSRRGCRNGLDQRRVTLRAY